MASKIYTISLPEHLAAYLEENSELSLSKITQAALNNIQENRSDLKERCKILEQKFLRALRFINEKKLGEEYANFEG